MTKIVVYTALFGPQAPRTLPEPTDAPFVFWYFTDQPDIQAPGWSVTKVATAGVGDRFSPRYWARKYKTLPHLFFNANASIWLDAAFVLRRPPSYLLTAAEALHTPVVAFRHPDRSTVQAEADEVVKLGLTSPAEVAGLFQHFQYRQFDPADSHRPLTATGLLVRWHSPEVAHFNTRWWELVTTYSLRDQLSVDYAAWETGVTIGYLQGHYRSNPYALYDRSRRIPRPALPDLAR